MSACLSDMTLEVSDLNNQVCLQHVAIAEGGADRALVVLTISPAHDSKSRVRTTHRADC
jgi:hypothetical protein